jgi:hypothetical protein
MPDQFMTPNELVDLARVAQKLNQHIAMTGAELSYSGEVHAVDPNGERLGVFYGVGDGWDFYPTGNLPEHREVSTDGKDALDRLYAVLDKHQGLTYDELLDILPVRD